MLLYLIYFIASFFFTSFVYKQMLIRKDVINIYDYPSLRKIHNKKILKVGGIGIIFSFLLTLFVYRVLNGEYIFQINSGEIQLAFSLIFLIIGGLVDDYIGLNAPRKLFFQLVSISVLLHSGLCISLFDSYMLNMLINACFYIIAINCMNLIDGIDGLSSGIFIIFSMALIVFANQFPFLDSKYYITIAILMGSILAFFSMNYPPAKIFLGDSGSQLLGWIMAVSVVHASSFYSYNYQKVYLISFLSVPFYDVILVMIKRFTSCEGSVKQKVVRVVQSDQNHIHHILISNNKENKRVLFILLVLFFCLTLMSLIPILFNNYHTIIFYLILFMYVTFRMYFTTRVFNNE